MNTYSLASLGNAFQPFLFFSPLPIFSGGRNRKNHPLLPRSCLHPWCLVGTFSRGLLKRKAARQRNTNDDCSPLDKGEKFLFGDGMENYYWARELWANKNREKFEYMARNFNEWDLMFRVDAAPHLNFAGNWLRPINLSLERTFCSHRRRTLWAMRHVISKWSIFCPFRIRRKRSKGH